MLDGDLCASSQVAVERATAECAPLSMALTDALHGERAVVISLGEEYEATLIATRNAKVSEDMGRMLHEIDGEMHMTVWAGDAAQPTLHVASTSREETVPLKAKLRSEMAQASFESIACTAVVTFHFKRCSQFDSLPLLSSKWHRWEELAGRRGGLRHSRSRTPRLCARRRSRGKMRAITQRGRSITLPRARRGRRRLKRAEC